MKIELYEIPVKDVVANYTNNDEEGVIGYKCKRIGNRNQTLNDRR